MDYEFSNGVACLRVYADGPDHIFETRMGNEALVYVMNTDQATWLHAKLGESLQKGSDHGRSQTIGKGECQRGRQDWEER